MIPVTIGDLAVVEVEGTSDSAQFPLQCGYGMQTEPLAPFS